MFDGEERREAVDFTPGRLGTSAAVSTDGLASLSSTSADDRHLSEVEAALSRTIDVIRDRLREGYPSEAQTAFEGMLKDLPAGSTPYVVFRLKSNIGHCRLQLGDKKAALEWFDMAHAAAPSEPKAMATRAFAMMVREDFSGAVALAKDSLAGNAENEELAATLVEASIHIAACPDPAPALSPSLRQRERVLVSLCIFHRDRDMRPIWWDEARTGANLFPRNRLLRLFAAEAEIDRIVRLTRNEDYRPLTEDERSSVKAAAETLDGFWRRMKVSEVPSREDGLSALSTLSLAQRLLEDRVGALKSACELTERTDQESPLLLAAQVALAFEDFSAAARALAKLPATGLAGFYKGVAAFNRGDWDQAADLFEEAEIPDGERSFVETVFRLRGVKGGSDPGHEAVLEEAREAAGADARSLVVISRLARVRGFSNLAETAYGDAVALIGPNLPIHDRITVASCARDMDDCDAVIRSLDGGIDPGALTTELHWLSDAHACETPPRFRNVRFFESLPDSTRLAPDIARGHAAALLAAGRPNDAERILRGLLRENETDAYLRLKLIESLRRTDRSSEVASLVIETREKMLQGPPSHRMAWAHELRLAGEGSRAITMGYDLVRDVPSSAEIALGYVGLVLGRPDGDFIPQHDEVVGGCWALIESERGELDAFTVDEGPSFLGTDVVSERDERARNVVGRRVGDTFVVTGMLGRTTTWTIKEVKSKFLHVLHVVMRTYRQRFPTAKGLDQITLPENDVEPLLEVVKDDEERRRRLVDEAYVKSHLPLALVAAVSGKDSLSFAAYLRRLNIDVMTSEGTLADRQVGIDNALENRGLGAVLDTYTAVVAAEIGMLPLLKSWFGRLTVARATVDELHEMSARAEGLMGRGTLTVEYVEGNFIRHEVSDDVVADQIELLRAARANIESECEVHAAVYPDDVPAAVAEFARKLGRRTLDPMVLAAHQGDILVTDDLPCRVMAAAVTGVYGTWLQAVLLAARQVDSIAPSELARFYVELAKRRHGNLWLDVPSLTVLFDQCSKDDFETVCSFVGKPGADMWSHTLVTSGFLNALWQRGRPDLRLWGCTSAIVSQLLRHRPNDWADWFALILVCAIDTPGLRPFLAKWLQGHFLSAKMVEEAVDRWRMRARRPHAPK